MSRGIHHVGLAVRSAEEVTKFFEEVFGAQSTDYSMETGEFLSRMIMVGTGLFELLEPRGTGGLIERFLDTNGEGLHHVSIVVDSLDEVLTACRKRGSRVVGNRFIHPKSAYGVLIELLDGGELR
jgi:methylmalonyl-CoA/ethylmalonyl-CoA epimerase